MFKSATSERDIERLNHKEDYLVHYPEIAKTFEIKVFHPRQIRVITEFR
jgi:hypothetical protein